MSIGRIGGVGRLGLAPSRGRRHGLIPVATRCGAPGTVVAGVGGVPGTTAYTSLTTRYRHYVTSDVTASDIHVQVVNWGIYNTGEIDVPNAVTWAVALEVNGVSHPVIFDGASSVTLPPGGSAVGTVPSLSMLTSSDVLYSRQEVSVASGAIIPTSRYTVSALGDGASTTPGQIGAVGALTGRIDVYGPTPAAILGRPTTSARRSVLIVGDSIASGSGDNTDAAGNCGFVERGLAASVGWIHATRAGWGLGGFTADHSRIWRDLLPYCDTVIVQSGINDLNEASISEPEFVGRATAAWAAVRAAGRRVVQTTIGPRTVGTWSTVEGQTVKNPTQEGYRTRFNDNLRSGAYASQIDLVIEVADVQETARNSGIWKAPPAYTGDGVHPLTSMHALMAAPVAAAAIV